LLSFNVRKSGNWYEAECSDLSLAISARDLRSIQETADRAARAKGHEAAVLIPVKFDPSPVQRLFSLLRSVGMKLPAYDPSRRKRHR
jgi:hypothetical protein